MNVETVPLPSWLLASPTAVPAPPAESRLQSLPFGDLKWENFERLCVRLERTNSEIEFCRLYGVPGQRQEGIDLYSRRRSAEKYRVHQCKRVTDFTPAKIDEAVKRFLDGEWSSKSETFVLCTKESLRSKERTDAVERNREALRRSGIDFEPWDAFELDVLLKVQPRIVNDFFGRNWARAFCDPASIPALEGRLDGAQVIQFRERLLIFYRRVFQVHDPGFPTGAEHARAMPLRERYVIPDVYQEQVQVSGPPAQPESKADPIGAPATVAFERRPSSYRAGEDQTVRTYQQRRPLDDWLADSPRHVLLGGPGIGKSSLLRFVLLDLLEPAPILKAVSTSHGSYLPVWISSPYWTTLRSNDSQTIPLTEAVHRWLQQWSEERLWPLFQNALEDDRLLLLVDGLDEYTNEDAARAAVSLLQVFVEQWSCRIIVTSRPVGFERLALREVGWRIGHLAEFTPAQQRQYAVNWFENQLRTTQEGVGANDVPQKTVADSADRALADLASSGDLRELAKIPLLLGLLIHLTSSNLPLPGSRFSAYGRLVEHLIATHPRARRKAALVSVSPSTFSTADETRVFAALAYVLHRDHPEGLVSAREAEEAIQQFLEDANGFAMQRSEAHRQAQVLLDFGEVGLGLLVRRAPDTFGFLHRTFQDFLAAEHLVHEPLVKQRAAVEEHGADPRWRDVILCLLHRTARSEDVSEIIGLMRRKTAGTIAAHTALSILCEVACGDFNCPVFLARELCEEVLDEIETGPWLAFREHLLRLILNGLRLTKVRELLQGRLGRWFPARHSRYSVPVALAKSSPTPDVVDCLLLLLHDEGEYCWMQAATALASMASSYADIPQRLLALCRGRGH